jgi:hypothetical protein
LSRRWLQRLFLSQTFADPFSRTKRAIRVSAGSTPSRPQGHASYAPQGRSFSRTRRGLRTSPAALRLRSAHLEGDSACAHARKAAHAQALLQKPDQGFASRLRRRDNGSKCRSFSRTRRGIRTSPADSDARKAAQIVKELVPEGSACGSSRLPLGATAIAETNHKRQRKSHSNMTIVFLSSAFRGQ